MVIDATAPSIPKVPSVEEAADHQSVSIKWDTVEGAEGYNIYVNGKLVTTEPVTTNTYTITGLEADSWYEVSVAATNSVGTSAPGLVKVVETTVAPENSGDTGNQGGNTGITYKKGDVDGNGEVELTDAQLALKAALKILSLDQAAALAADVTGDGITLGDAQLILKVALKITTF